MDVSGDSRVTFLHACEYAYKKQTPMGSGEQQRRGAYAPAMLTQLPKLSSP